MHHPHLLRLLEEGLQTKDKTVAAYCLEISNPSVCEQIINEINQVLRETDSVYDCEQYKYVVKLLTLLSRSVCFCDQSKEEGGGNPVGILFKKMLKIYIKTLEKLDQSVTGRDDYLGLVIESLIQFYPTLVNKIFEEPLTGREWRTYMRKVCLLSLDLAIDNYFGLHK